MAFYGYEDPIALPLMNVYNTDMMRLIVSSAKEQYDQAVKDYNDFMKSYLDFYSDVPGDTERYYNMTIGGAKDMINLMISSGVDPFKNPEARAAIGRYIASVPVGRANEMRIAAETAKEYKKNRDRLIAAGQYDPEQERWENNGRTLEDWESVTADGAYIPWTRTTPSPKFDSINEASPYFERFKAQEYLRPSRPGYAIYGTKDENKEKAIDAAMKGLAGEPGFEFLRYKANKLAEGRTHEDGTPVTGEEILRDQYRTFANQFFQEKEDVDQVAMDRIRTSNDIYAHKAKRDYDIAHPLPSSSGRKSSRRDALDPESESYRPLYASASAALSDIIKQNRYSISGPGTALVANSFKDAQDNIFLPSRRSDSPSWSNVSWIATPTINQALDLLTRSDDAARYASQQGRKAVNGVESAVLFMTGDENNLYSPEELAYMAGYRKTKGNEGIKTREHIRKAAAAAGDKPITKTDIGKVTTIQIGDRIRVFKPIKVAGTTMYEDTGYYLYPDGDYAGEIDEDKSYGAMQQDTYSARRRYGMRQGQIAGELNM